MMRLILISTAVLVVTSSGQAQTNKPQLIIAEKTDAVSRIDDYAKQIKALEDKKANLELKYSSDSVQIKQINAQIEMLATIRNGKIFERFGGVADKFSSLNEKQLLQIIAGQNQRIIELLEQLNKKK